MRRFLPTGARLALLLPFLLVVAHLSARGSTVDWRAWLCPFAAGATECRADAYGVLAFAAPLPPVIDPAGPFCVNAPNVTLTATPPGGTWSGTGIINPATGLFSPSTAGTGSHLITYTDPTSSSATITIVVWSAPTIVFISGDGTDCNGESTGNTILTVSGGTQFSGPLGCKYRYDWDWDGTPYNDDYPSGCSGGIDLEDLSNLPAGTYTVTVTDANGCSATGTAEVNEPPAIILSADDVELECFGQTGEIIDLSVSGGIPGYTYDWDYDGTGDNNDPQDPAITGPGTYTVIVTDFLGCTATLSVEVTEPDELEADASSEAVLCSGESSGSIDLTVSGGTPGYQYDWDYDGVGDNNDPQDPANLPAGTYNVTVTDANGCTTTASVEVTEPTAAVTADVTGFDVTCFGADDGSVDLTPGGGTGSYTFDWSNDGVGDNNDPEDLDDLPPGSYSVTVTDANGCTAVATVTLNEPAEITGTHTETICAGGSVVINGTTYDENNPSGTEVFTAANGCDSTVTVTLSFDPPLEGEETYEGCTGDGYSVVVGGTVYNEANPSGTEVISNAEGCDSIVTINLVFLEEVTGEETYDGCQGDGYSVIVNGTVYNESNPTGTEILISGAGCDSVVTIALNFAEPTEETISYSGCEGDGYSIVINGTVYDENNPTGQQVIENAAGCDSTITIDLSFGETSEEEFTHTACAGDGYSITIGGTVFDEGNPTGSVVLTNADGCDSTINVTLTFLPPTTGTETYTGCQGDGYEVVVNGTVYNEGNPSGTETLVNGQGCDSIVTIALTFLGPVYGSETYTGCQGDGYSVIVGGTVFDEGNPTGTVTLVSGIGCDSIVQVNLTFNANTTASITYEGCAGDGYSVVVNGNVYNEGNPTGVEVIPNAAGCDSTITINLVFDAVSQGEVSYTGCQGDGYEVVVNGTAYNEANPTGTEVLTNGAGCDSTVTINLQFAPPDTTEITYNGCIGDGYSIVVNGETYDEGNQDGTEVMTNGIGCDSVIIIDLNFTNEIITILDPLLCHGESIVVNGTVYDENNPSGEETFIAQGGCDSIVVIDLSFLPELTGEFYPEVCIGGSIVVNGTVYDETNPAGVEVFTTPLGCDSTVTVEIQWVGPLTGEFYADVCEGGFIIVNGTVYDENNPTGTEVFTTPEGCDSVVTVEIGFLPILTGEETYSGCTGDGYFVVVGGTIYNEANPSGTELLQTPGGCDSLVTINLQFNTAGSSEILYNGCTGDGYSVTVNGVVYDESNPDGFEQIETPFGCDSLVAIDLDFAEPDTGYVTHVGCTGDGFEVVINGNTYDEVNPSGVEIVQTPAGCDSVVVISLSFEDVIETEINPEVCAGGSVTIGGIVYDASNPSDTLYLVAIGGCDSIVYIQLDFLPVLEGEETYSGCIGDGYAVTVNGVLYDESNPAGTEYFQNGEGCDTVVTVNLVFGETVEAIIDPTLCKGESIVVNGTVYDESNPTGTEIIPGQGTCDTMIMVSLAFHPADTTEVTYTGCQGDGYAVTVNGTVYNEANPDGIAVLPGSDGCDSTIVVGLVFENCCVGQSVTVNAAICSGFSYAWRGQSYDQTGTYTDVVPNAVGPGCDSTYILELIVDDAVTATFDIDICEGEDFPFGSSIYITSGIYRDTLVGGSAQGCDSIIVLDLTVHPMPMVNAGPDVQINCDNPEVVLAAQVNAGEVLWQGPDISAANQHELNPRVSKPGVYTLTVISPAGCEASDQVLVTADASVPVSEAGPDQALTCDILSVMLFAAPSGQNLDWYWEGPGINASNAHMLNPVVNAAGTYVLHVTDTVSLCQAAPDTVIVADNTPDVEAVIDVTFLQNCGVALDGSGSTLGGAIIYWWLDAFGNVLSSDLILQLSGPGSYTLMVEDTLTGCEDSVVVQIINWLDIPDVTAGEDKVIDCRNLSVPLDAVIGTPSPALVFQWSGPAGGILGPAAQPSIMAGLPGWYVLEVVDTTTGCTVIDSAWVDEQSDPPAVSAVVDHHITCDMPTGLLLAYNGGPADNIVLTWLSADGNVIGAGQQLAVNNAGTYILEALNAVTGCMVRDTTEIFATEAPFGELVVTPENCAGDLQGSIMVADVQGGLPPFTYVLNGTVSQALPFFDGLVPGTYSVQVVDDAGCTWMQDAIVEEGLAFTLDIGADITIQPGESAQLHSTVSIPWTQVDSIVWTPREILSCANCPNPVATATYSTTITATAWSNGCFDSASIQLRVDAEHDVYIPNVFSPNADGINDHFTIYGKKSLKQVLRLEVYDRWGNNVFIKENFDPNDPRQGWNGTFRGEPLNPGVYVFRAEVEFTDGYIDHYGGDVTLLR